MNKCLNLCELITPQSIKKRSIKGIISRALEKESFEVDRIYLGSNFCSQFFLNTSSSWDSIFDYAKNNNISVTLTLPIFSQKDLNRAKIRIGELLENDEIDEVTVNDFGNLKYIKENFDKKINLGRLFFKDPRDIRVPNYFNSEITPAWLTQLDQIDDISGIELDMATQKIKLPETVDPIISVHYPYTYMTTGNICKFASISKPLEKKFRPNDSCKLECSKIHEFYVEDFGENRGCEIFRLGRSVYFLNDKANFTETGILPDRMIYFPLKELMEID